jgi:hypothetical protein
MTTRTKLFISLGLLACVLVAQAPTNTITVTVPTAALLDLRQALLADNAKLTRLRAGVATPVMSDEEFFRSNFASMIAQRVITGRTDLAPRLADESQADWANRILAKYKSQITVVIQ